MRKKLIVTALLLAFCFVTIIQAKASVYVSFNMFYGDLSPYGTWASVPGYGEVWYPFHHHHFWRPYLYGHWEWTDAGWMWVSDEDFGWITYHYGRWTYDPLYGWIWIPGSVWAPTWVSWYWGPDYIGWAPLPPYGYDDDYLAVYPGYINYCGYGSFLSLDLYRHCAPAWRDSYIGRHERFRDSAYVADGRSVRDPGPDPSYIEHRTGTRVREMRLESTGRYSAAARNGRMVGNRMYVYRPRVNASGKYRTPMLRNEERGVVGISHRTFRMRGATSAMRGRSLAPRHTSAMRGRSFASRHTSAMRGRSFASRHTSAMRGRSLASHRTAFRGRGVSPGRTAFRSVAPRRTFAGGESYVAHRETSPHEFRPSAQQFHPAPMQQFHPAASMGRPSFGGSGGFHGGGGGGFHGGGGGSPRRR